MLTNKPEVFLLDVDGVLTTGQFFYSADGKQFKVFGPDDHDGLSLLKGRLQISFITGDSKGFEISKRRIVDDMGFPLHLVSTVNRIDWICGNWDASKVIYMGDGIFDHYVFREVGYSIAPHNADMYLKSVASFVTQRAGGDRAVAEACLHVLERFFEPYDPQRKMGPGFKASGHWPA